METWDMIKEMATFPKKRFNNEYGNVVGLNKEGVLSWLQVDGKEANDPFIIGKSEHWNSLNCNWTTVKQPVTWQEAIQAWAFNNKEIYTIDDYGNEASLKGSAEAGKFLKEEFTNRQWYIR